MEVENERRGRRAVVARGEVKLVAPSGAVKLEVDVRGARIERPALQPRLAVLADADEAESPPQPEHDAPSPKNETIQRQPDHDARSRTTSQKGMFPRHSYRSPSTGSIRAAHREGAMVETVQIRSAMPMVTRKTVGLSTTGR